MQRSLVLALLLLLAAVTALVVWFYGGSHTPPPPPGTTPAATEAPPVGPEAATAGGVGTASPNRTVREAVAVRGADLLDDPDIRAGLCGFKGRVVDHREAPVPDCGVRLYRGALDSVLQTGGDLFADEPQYEPDYIAGETRTATDGTFQLTGVFPGGFYLLFAGLGTDAPTHQIVTRTPSRGEIVDLGDVVLNDAGVIVGSVYDDRGEPLAGALVRAADVPGALAAFFPVERFDPEGAVLVREPQSPVRVLRMPPWVKRAFEHLPVPTTRSGSDGSFRLVGVMPGSNMLATTADGFLSDVKPSVQVRGGQEKDVGRIRMRRGEELLARVLDTKGKPIEGAEVLAGSTITMAPFDLAQDLGATDAEGRINGTGFSPGKVTVAARRTSHDAWVLAEPQSILGEVVVTLPATFGVTATVRKADGSKVEQPRLKLLHGKKGDGAAEMYLMGLAPPVDLDGRQRQLEDGRLRIDDLLAGTYTLLVEADGHATGAAVFEIADADAAVEVELAMPKHFAVRVLDLDDQPIKNAAVFAEARGERVVEMPVRCGRTDGDGRLTIDKLQAETLRVSAEHPRWGVVHGEAKPGEELVLRLSPPGALHGQLVENGKPPLPGKYSIGVMWRRSGGARGPLDQVPSIVSAGVDGGFTVRALQPGKYNVVAIQSLDALRSPGSVFTFAQDMFIGSNTPSEEVEVVSGQTAEVTLEVGEKPLEGPTAQLTGSVTVDGRLGAGYTVTAYANNRRFGARVDERGRFDIGLVPAGDVWVSVLGSEGGIFMGPGSNLWSSSVTLKEAEVRELTIDVVTSTLSGTAWLPDGSVAAGVFVQGSGRLKTAGDRGNVWLHTSTDANGEFRFRQVPEGTWSLQVRGGNGETRLRGSLDGIEVSAGIPVEGLRLEVRPAMVVKGRVDLSSFGANKPNWGWLGFYRLQVSDEPTASGDYADGVGIDTGTGGFVADDLTPGRYRIEFNAYDGQNSKGYPCGTLVVPEAGLSDVVLVPRSN